MRSNTYNHFEGIAGLVIKRSKIIIFASRLNLGKAISISVKAIIQPTVGEASEGIGKSNHFVVWTNVVCIVRSSLKSRGAKSSSPDATIRIFRILRKTPTATSIKWVCSHIHISSRYLPCRHYYNKRTWQPVHFLGLRQEFRKSKYDQMCSEMKICSDARVESSVRKRITCISL